MLREDRQRPLEAFSFWQLESLTKQQQKAGREEEGTGLLGTDSVSVSWTAWAGREQARVCVVGIP